MNKRSGTSSKAGSSRGSSVISSPGGGDTESNSIAHHDQPNQSGIGESSDGCKNELLDTLIKKFNLNVDIDEGLVETPSDTSKSTANPFQYANKIKNIMKYPAHDDGKKRVGELQKKIHRSQMKQSSMGDANNNGTSTTTSESSANQPIRQKSGIEQKQKKELKIKSLPQAFLCKYIGKTRCSGLWGVRHTRQPIETLINTAKRLKSVDEMPTVEALVSEKGIYVVQKNTAMAAPNNSNNKKPQQQQQDQQRQTTQTTVAQRTYRSGLIPIGNISYGVQDSKYSKVFSCIVVRERDAKTTCECYAFLNSKVDGARRMLPFIWT